MDPSLGVKFAPFHHILLTQRHPMTNSASFDVISSFISTSHRYAVVAPIIKSFPKMRFIIQFNDRFSNKYSFFDLFSCWNKFKLTYWTVFTHCNARILIQINGLHRLNAFIPFV
eukprot:8075_1